MTKNIDDGGQAFPGEKIVWDAPNNPTKEIGRVPMQGMTLRDWFAGQALASMKWIERDTTFEDDSAMAYRMADAMLKARQQQ